MRRERMRCRQWYFRGALAAIGGVLGLLLWMMVQTPGAQEKSSPAQNADEPPLATRMHQFHITDLELDCTECHSRQDDAPAGQEWVYAVRPGHEQCEACHDEIVEQKNPQGNFCQICHASAETAVGPFPSGERNLAQFSHVMHVDPKGRRNAQGVRLDCALCHTADATRRVPPSPDHAQCSVCHAGEGAVQPVIADGKNLSCVMCHALPKIDAILAKRLPGSATPAATPPAGYHATASSPWVTVTGSPYRDIVPFPHDRHVQRRDGTPIDCFECHSAVLKRDGFGAHDAVPTMSQCASCHDNASWVRQPYLTKECHICHTRVRADMRPQASHPVSRQLVHHAGFARLHQKQASAPDSLCSTCHRGFVDAEIDQCAGCHSSMQPRSHHALQFSEIGHGRQAAFNRQACATCHTADFCVSCHSVPPRSHIPLAFFRSGGHRQLARMNPRSCFVCHQFESTCQECHNRSLR